MLKSGSTALYRYLDQHPETLMCPVKEPNFFASEIRLANFDADFQRRAVALREFLAGSMTGRCSAGPVGDWRDYLRLFRHSTGSRAIGEASVSYLPLVAHRRRQHRQARPRCPLDRRAAQSN